MKFRSIISFFVLLGFVFCTNAAESTLLNDTLPEVVVTNSRQQMLLASKSDLPTTFYSYDIDKFQITSAKDFSAFVPSLYMPDYGSAMTSSIYMRGLGARIDNPVVGLYIDGVGLANKNSFDFQFLDIRDVNIFRGPQGTLFGKNTIGGLINIRLLSPLSYQGTRASVTYANQNYALVKASHYAKFNDKVGLALGAFYRHCDGYFVNQYDGKLTDWNNQAGGFLKLEFMPTENIKISNLINYNFIKQGAFPYHKLNQPVNHNDYCGYNRHNLIDGLNIEINFENVVLNSTTSYQFLKDHMIMDQDYMPYSYFTLEQQQKEHYIEQNFTLRNRHHTKILKNDEITLDADKRSFFAWDWIAGLSISHKQNDMSAPVTFFRDGIDTIILANANVFGDAARYDIREQQFTIYSDFLTPTTNVALYHTSYLTWNNWQLELGLRLDYEKSSFRYQSHSHFSYNFTPYLPEYQKLECNFNGVSNLQYFEVLPRIAASYTRPNWSVFASITEGHKAGGFNSQLFADIVKNQMTNEMMQQKKSQDIDDVITYQPERCLTSEIGGRYNYSNKTWKVNTELRLYDNELFNQQLTVFKPNTTGRQMTNAGRSRSLGVELTAAVRFKGLSANLSYGYTFDRFVRYQDGANNYAGNHIPYIPDNTLSVGLAYQWDIQHDVVRAVTISAQSKTIGSIYWDNQNIYKQPIYSLLDANIILSMKYVELSIWGQNLTNTQYNVFYFESLSNVFMQSGKPITYGATIKLEI